MSDNFAAACIQTYLEHGLITIKDKRIERNHNISYIGTTLWLWLNDYFFNAEDVNSRLGKENKIDRKELLQKFITDNPKQGKYTTSHTFKKKIIVFCETTDLIMNPFIELESDKSKNWGGDLKTGGASYWFFIKKEDFDKDTKAGDTTKYEEKYINIKELFKK